MWIAIKFCTDFRVPQGMISNDFGDPPDMHTVTPCAPSSVMLLAVCMDSVIGWSQRHTDVCSHEQPLFL